MIASKQIAFGRGGGKQYEECKYVRSDGRSFVIIPHVHKTKNYIKIACSYCYTGAVQYDRNLFGGADDSDQNGCTAYKVPGHPQIVQLYGPTSYYNPVENANEIIDGQFNTIEFTFDASQNPARVFELNGSTAGSPTTPAVSNFYSYVAGIKMALFTQIKGDVALPARITSTVGFRSFMYWDGRDNLVANLVSCVDESTGEGYFYNKVDNSRIYNSSSEGLLIAVL